MSTPAQHGVGLGYPAPCCRRVRHPPYLSRQEADMAHIRCTLRPHFTGQVGPVRFRNGHGETADPEALAYFRALPDEYEVDEPEQAPFIGPKPEDPTDPQE